MRAKGRTGKTRKEKVRFFKYKCQESGISCYKLCHATKSAAKRHMERLAMMKQEHYEYLNVYLCFKCDSWHVGHSMPRQGVGNAEIGRDAM